MKKALPLTLALLLALSLSLSLSAVALEAHHNAQTSTLWGNCETMENWYLLPGDTLLISRVDGQGTERFQRYEYKVQGDTLEIYAGGELQRSVPVSFGTDAELAQAFEQPAEAPVWRIGEGEALLGFAGESSPLEGLWTRTDGTALLFFQGLAHTLGTEADDSYLYLGGAAVVVDAATVQVLENWDDNILRQALLDYQLEGDTLTLDGEQYSR